VLRDTATSTSARCDLSGIAGVHDVGHKVPPYTGAALEDGPEKGFIFL
jgi:hypothetical protein